MLISHLSSRLPGFITGAASSALVITLGLYQASAFQPNKQEYVDLNDVLGEISLTSAAYAVEETYITPSDHTRARYIQYRINSAEASDTEVLLQYRRRIRILASARDREDAAMPVAIAQGLADPVHALWREIVQRGLPLPRDLQSFDEVWRSVTQG